MRLDEFAVQLASNPIDEDSRPRYAGDLFWSAMLIATVATLSTHGVSGHILRSRTAPSES